VSQAKSLNSKRGPVFYLRKIFGNLLPPLLTKGLFITAKVISWTIRAIAPNQKSINVDLFFYQRYDYVSQTPTLLKFKHFDLGDGK